MTVSTTTNNVQGITPDSYAGVIITAVEAKSVAAQVTTVISTDATKVHIPLVTGDPSASWVAEGAEIGASDPTIDDITAEPAKLAGLTIITNELSADTTPAAADLIGQRISNDIAKKIDVAFFGSKGTGTVQPAGLEDVTGFTHVAGPAAWTNLDPFAEAISNADVLGLELAGFVANPADALTLAKLKTMSTSNLPLLGSDPTTSTRRQLLGVPLYVSEGVTAGTVWGLPRERVLIVRRNDVDLQFDKSAYFTSDRTAIRATIRVTFAFPHAAAIQKVSLTA